MIEKKTQDSNRERVDMLFQAHQGMIQNVLNTHCSSCTSEFQILENIKLALTCTVGSGVAHDNQIYQYLISKPGNVYTNVKIHTLLTTSHVRLCLKITKNFSF